MRHPKPPAQRPLPDGYMREKLGLSPHVHVSRRRLLEMWERHEKAKSSLREAQTLEEEKSENAERRLRGFPDLTVTVEAKCPRCEKKLELLVRQMTPTRIIPDVREVTDPTNVINTPWGCQHFRLTVRER